VTFEDRVRALEPWGFTPRQARFVVMVAMHGGYCLRRQYQTFAGVAYGSVVREFLDALVTRRLAKRFSFRRNRGHLYHLHATAIYRALGQEGNRNRRRVSPAQIARKLMALDYLLSEPQVEWLATEQEKVALFRDRFGIGVEDLPQRMYTAADAGRDTTRFFIHKQPIGMAPDSDAPEFVCVVPDLDGRALEQFLEDHRRLFARLPAWRVTAVCPPHVAGLPVCQSVFDRVVRVSADVSADAVEELSWYFATREKVDRDDVAAFSMADITRFRTIRARQSSPRVEALYDRWRQHGSAALAAPAQDAVALTSGRLVVKALSHRYEQFGSLPGVY